MVHHAIVKMYRHILRMTTDKEYTCVREIDLETHVDRNGPL